MLHIHHPKYYIKNSKFCLILSHYTPDIIRALIAFLTSNVCVEVSNWKHCPSVISSYNICTRMFITGIRIPLFRRVLKYRYFCSVGDVECDSYEDIIKLVACDFANSFQYASNLLGMIIRI